MFAIGVRFLNGWAMAAADGARKERAEWPPHPDRVFMALAAAWFESDQDPAEGAALRWLESLAPPAIRASGCSFRTPVVHFVPVNDDSSPVKKGAPIGEFGSMPIGRKRQPRGFPVAIPKEDRVFYIWPDADAGCHATALGGLCRKVARLGHSASFVQMWVTADPPQPNLVPVEGLAEHRLRVPAPGRLDYLEARYNRTAVLAWAELTALIKRSKGKEKKALEAERARRFGGVEPVSLRPEPWGWQGYSRPAPPPRPPVRGTVFDQRLIVLSLSGRRLDLPATQVLVETLRDTLMSRCPVQPPPEWLSGHTADGRRSEKPHLAIAPLAFVGAEHADGRILGVAIILPRAVEPKESARCLTPVLLDEFGLPRDLRLFAGRWMECGARLETRESPPWSLRSDVWTRPSRLWASVTPVVLDRHFDGPDRWERAAEVVKDACERIGLPRPREAILHPVSLFEGVPHAREFARLVRKRDGGAMTHSHVLLVFEEEVSGPVLIGAGRYRGYGLCRPLFRGDHE